MLTRSQLKALGTIIDTTASDGTDSGKTAVHKIAGSDAPPVFTAGDMTALGNAHIAVVAPPNDPTQNDGTTVITGRGMTFDITWDSSVASAPAAFQTDVEEVLPVCIKAGALGGNAPRRDLWISPHHAMYFDSASAGGVLIEAKDLVNGISIVQAEHVDRVEYFHIELETHDVIIAEGALSESFIDDDSRGMFHNALEFHALYPQAARNAAQYCAPRREDGYEVEAVRRRIAGFARPGDLALAG